jgi:hypothetical protein
MEARLALMQHNRTLLEAFSPTSKFNLEDSLHNVSGFQNYTPIKAAQGKAATTLEK